MSTAHRVREAAAATALYGALTVVFTWPLAAGLARDLPGDFGDPLLNSWILAWNATHFGRGWWNANIFYPHPLALGYSEHLAAQAAQILPIYWLTGNPILCYNLVFLSTFVLSGLGMFLFARELTGHRGAAIVAGAAYAFAPFRVASLPHIQELSSAWMPFVLFGLRRYFSTRRTRPLVGATAAWILQNLSCGYYLLFFLPVVAVYLAWELTVRGLWRDRRTMMSIAAACGVVVAATAPFVVPYLELRRLGFNPRSLKETQKFSADVYAYFTADPNLRIWGTIARAWPKAEGALFPGLTVTVLALLGVARPFQGRDHGGAKRPALLTMAFLVIFGVVVLLLLGYSIRLPGIKITSLSRALMIATIAFAAVLALSRDARERTRAWLASPAGCFTLITLFAIAMSFGPTIYAQDRSVLDSSLYGVFYRFVPGFDGLRVPARYAMIVALGLSTLAALGVSSVDAGGHAGRPLHVLGVVLLFLAVALEGFAAPIAINQNPPDYKRPGLAPLPDLQRPAPAVYDFIATLPPTAAIVELPLGEPAFDVRYMYYSTRHWRPLVNGYTGGQPRDYENLDQSLQDLASRPERAWTTLIGTRATHAIVHEHFYTEGRGPQVSAWLKANGAREIAAFGPDRVFQMP